MFSCFDNNCHKSHKKKLNICEFTKINLNPLNFLTPVCVCVCVCVCVELTLQYIFYVIRKITNIINMFILLY